MTARKTVQGLVDRLTTWWEETTLGRILGRSADLHLDLVAAGMAFFGLLAVFPGLAALVSVYGLLSDPAEVQSQLAVLQTLMPGNAWSLIDKQLTSVASAAPGALGFGVIFGLLFTMWSATRGMRSLVNALNIIHGVQERRNLLMMNAMAYGLTVVVILFGALSILVIVGVPTAIRFIGLDGGGWLTAILPWVVLTVVATGVLGLVYKVAPAERRQPWRRVLKGAVAATVLWVVASAAFTVYVGSFGTFNATYGSLGAVVVLLLWMMLSARIVLMGAVWNALDLEPRRNADALGQPQPQSPADEAGTETKTETKTGTETRQSRPLRPAAQARMPERRRAERRRR